MKLKQVGWMLGIVAVVSFTAVPSAHAAKGVLGACKKELKTFGCAAKTDAQAHECLEKNEKHDAKDDGFSHACSEAHEAYEKKMGSEEAGEHHSDSPEKK
jgi:hypothetical protein